MKNTISILANAFIPLLVMALFLNFISLNMSYAILLGSVALFVVSASQGKIKTNVILKILLIAAPISIAFYFLVLKEIPGLWIAIPLFLLSVILGQLFKKKKQNWFAITGLAILVGLVSFFYVPEIISRNLSQEFDEPAITFNLTDLDTDEKITNASIKNKVVVLDFFGTWCAPCILEMAELKDVKSALVKYDADLEFIIACTQKGGDTPEKAKKFREKRELPFRLAFDTGSINHKNFGFTGVPGLVIIDKKGHLRFKHEGYNEAENLSKTLLPLITELLNEE